MTEKTNKSALQRRLIPTYIFLIIVSFISVFPLYWMISAATNTSTDVSRGRILPGTYFMQNFKNLTAQQPLWRALGNSLFYAVLTTVLCLLICSIAGYGFEVYHDRWKDRLFSILLLAMMVPQVATMVPLFKMFSKAGLLNTAVGFILPIISTPFMIMMFRQNARAFPIDIIEAARIDGLSEFLFETDCPYMAPEPIRGLEGEPAMISITANALVNDRVDRTGEDAETIAQAAWENACKLFQK